ncbi:MAG TPA: tyrosine-type recombinase/integrase, partial [Acidothermaceae bacterium]
MSDAVAQYIGSRRNLATSTLLNDQAVLRKFARGVGVDREIGYVTPEQIEAHFRTLDGQRASSWNKARQRIGLFQVYARNHGWVRGPDWFRDVPKRTVPSIERMRLSPIELAELPSLAQDPRDRALLAIAVHTGLRSGEVASLRIGDVDLELRELYVFRSKSQRDDR